MNQYIIDLVKHNNRVIIPNFGAFIVAREKGVTILFNSFLQFNDGLLAGFVAESENIEVDAALEKIQDFVSQLKAQLSETGMYTLTGLGSFYTEPTGTIKFEQQSSILPIQSKETEQATEEDILLHFEPQPLTHAEGTLDSEKWNEPIRHEILEAPLIELQPEVAKTKTIKPKEHTKKRNNDTKSTSKRPILMLLTLVVVIISVFLYFLLKDSTPEKSKPIIETIPAVAEQSIIPETQTPAEPTEPKVASIQNGFHIIVGSHQTVGSAQEMAQKLHVKGYKNAQVLARGNRFLVSIESAPTSREADRIQQEILDSNRIESWIITIR